MTDALDRFYIIHLLIFKCRRESRFPSNDLAERQATPVEGLEVWQSFFGRRRRY